MSYSTLRAADSLQRMCADEEQKGFNARQALSIESTGHRRCNILCELDNKERQKSSFPLTGTNEEGWMDGMLKPPPYLTLLPPITFE